MITKYEIIDSGGAIYSSKFEGADNLVNLNAHHVSVEKNTKEILYFKIKVTLNDGEITGSPTTKTFPALSGFYALQYECFPTQYDINFDLIGD